MIRFYFCILFFALLGYLPLKAQYEIDAGIQLGGANYLGEIGGGAEEGRGFLFDMDLQQTNLAISGFFRYGINRSFGLKFTASYARISGADSLSDNPARKGRNLSFRTDLFEASLVGEYVFYQNRDIFPNAMDQIKFRAYGFAGFGALLFYPFAKHQDDWFSLRPLQTEGAENAYGTLTLILPLGGGIDFSFQEKFRLGFEVGYRISFTDYLDDISTDFAFPEELPFSESLIFANRSDEAFKRSNGEDLPDREIYSAGKIRGNPDDNDGYLMAQITFSYIIKAGRAYYQPKMRGLKKFKRVKSSWK